MTGVPATAIALAATPRGVEDERRLAERPLPEIAREFEAILLTQVLGAMRRTIPSSGLLHASASRRLFDGAFDHEVARSLATRTDLGVARQLAAEIGPTAPRGAVAAAFAQAVARGAGVGTSGGGAETAARAAGGQVALDAAPAARSVPRALPAATGHTMPPLAEGRLTSAFGMRRDPITNEPRFHAGIDLAAPRGTAIRAVADGEVVFSGWRGRAGRVVEVRHADGLITSYAHAERTLVHAGQRVAAGEVVATVGSSGRTTGAHLHFAARRDGRAVDPHTILTGARAPMAPVGATEHARGPRAGSVDAMPLHH